MFYGLLYLYYSNSAPSSAEVKNERSFTSSPPLCLHGVDRAILPLTLPVCTAHQAFNSSVVSYLTVMSYLFHHL
jgi:hypothetical protein